MKVAAKQLTPTLEMTVETTPTLVTKITTMTSLQELFRQWAAPTKHAMYWQ